MSMPCKAIEQMMHGGLLGACFGTIAAGIEYALLHAQNAYIGNLAKVYSDIMLPYTIAGLVAGACVALVLGLALRRPLTMSQYLARLSSVLIACIILAYLLRWATYKYLLPLWKPSNLIAYAASIAVAAILGMAFYYLVKRVLERWERRGPSAVGLRVGLPVVLLIALMATFGALPMIVQRAHAVDVAMVSTTESPSRGNRPPILFILVDTLRADHLPMYGYTRQTAPHLSALAASGVTVTHMYAPASATRPSIASIFSALYPAAHQTNHERDFLPDAIVTLAETLQQAGYQTFGVSANPNVSPVFGFSQGFDAYHLSRPESAFRLTKMGSIVEDVLGKQLITRVMREESKIKNRADAITDFTR